MSVRCFGKHIKRILYHLFFEFFSYWKPITTLKSFLHFHVYWDTLQIEYRELYKTFDYSRPLNKNMFAVHFRKYKGRRNWF